MGRAHHRLRAQSPRRARHRRARTGAARVAATAGRPQRLRPHNATRYTTTATVEVEQRVLDLAQAGRAAGRAVVAVSQVENAIAAAGLDDDQADAVRRLTTAGEAVACVVGPAGAGKSRTMGAVAAARQRAGVPVRGVALSAIAAGVLAAEAGIRADTIAKLIYEHARPDGPDEPWRLRPGEVVVDDETGMVSSRDLAQIILLADDAKAKVVLVGDHAQLDAIEAGGLFRLLAYDLRASELATLHRFAEPWEADASLALRRRDPASLRAYAEHGRIGAGDRLARGDAVDPMRVLADILRRETHERSAVHEIRHVLARSESLAVLKPRLANLEHWIKTNTPVDHSVDLERARRRLADAHANLKPGVLTRRGRHDRQLLDEHTAAVERLAAHKADRQAWLNQHADTFAYRDDLANQIAARRLELGRQAAVDQPAHLTQMLGPYPDSHRARDTWVRLAARVEAYRDEFGVDPADLHRSPIDGVQHREWSSAIDTPRRLEALSRPVPARVRETPERGVARGFGIDL